MLKAVARDQDGNSLMMFGLSEKNIERLVDGQPILMKLDEIREFREVLQRGGKIRAVIFYGKTEMEMAAMFNIPAEKVIPKPGETDDGTTENIQ